MGKRRRVGVEGGGTTFVVALSEDGDDWSHVEERFEIPGTQIAFFQMQTLRSRRRKMRVKVSTAQRDTFEANDLSAHMLVKKTEEKKLSPTTTRNRTYFLRKAGCF